MGKVQRVSSRPPRTAKWFFFDISANSAKILFFLALLGTLALVFSLFMLTISFLQVLSYTAYLQNELGSTYGTMNLGWGIGMYAIYYIFLLILLFICIYTLAVTAKFRSH